MYKNELNKHNEGVCRNMLNENQNDDFDGWGFSNTPPNDKNQDKRILIDWISYTFADIDYNEFFNQRTQKYDLTIQDNKKNSFILNSLLRLMDIKDDYKSIEIQNYALNGYRFSWIIGESIKINFAGPKMSNENYSTQILFSGSACREFEDYYKGSFINLFNFLFSEHEELGYSFDNNGEIISPKKFNGSFKRIDIAIDDFTGKEQNIYDLQKYAEKHWWIGSYKSILINDSSIRNGYIQSKGFSMTFGSSGSNQLVIYDKKLEMQSKKAYDIYSPDLWYRYEMRFVQDKADRIAKYYYMSCQFNKLKTNILELLNTCIEFKQIRDPSNDDFSRQYLRTQPTLESWRKFTEYTKKTKLTKEITLTKTIDRKLKWINDSLVTTFAELYLINRDNLEDFYNQILKYVNKGMFKLDTRSLAALNKYLKTNNKKEISEFEFKQIKNYGLLKEVKN